MVSGKPRHSRWHVAGDILSVDYFRQMCRITAHHPRIRFLVFTKVFNIVNCLGKHQGITAQFGSRLAGE